MLQQLLTKYQQLVPTTAAILAKNSNVIYINGIICKEKRVYVMAGVGGFVNGNGIPLELHILHQLLI